MDRDLHTDDEPTRSRIAWGIRNLGLFAVLPFILLMNACSLIMVEETGRATSQALVAKSVLVNGGAMTNFKGSVEVMPRYTPPIWPLNVLVSCRALDFESDPNIAMRWERDALVITHDPLDFPVHTTSRCYKRTIILENRSTTVSS